MRRCVSIPFVGVFALALTGLIATCPARAAAPVKVGLAYPLTGAFAAQGVPIVNAIKQAFDEENYSVAGRTIELITEDSEGKPDVALTKLRKLVERDRVQLLHAGLSSAVGYAVRDYVHSQGVPWVTVAASAGLTREKASPYVFRFVPSTFQWAYAPARWLKEKQGWQKIVWIGANYAAPREGFEALKKVYGPGIVEAVWPSIGAPDYAPFLARVDAAKADGAVLAMWGSDAARVTRQYEEYGLKAKLPAFGYGSFTSEELLPGMPPAIEGFLSAYTYCGTLDTPLNKRFVEGFKARYKALPGSYMYMAYMGTKLMIQAIKEVGGRVEDRQAYVAALARARVDGPMGTVSFDDRHGMVGDFYMLKVVKKDGQLQNECIDKIPQVRDPYDLLP